MPAGGAPVTVTNQTGTASSPAVTQSAPLSGGADRAGTNSTNGFTIAEANVNRRRLDFQNTSDTDMRVSEFTAAPASATVGFKIAANQAFSTVTNQKVTGYCAATGKTYQATEI